MRLVRARVTNYKSIDDSGWVSIDNVTSLVGKNESGKTAFLQALRRLNPVSGSDAEFDLKDYPRKGYVRYKRTHKDAPATVVRCEFELSDEELAGIEASHGPDALGSRRVIAAKGYDNKLRWEMDVDDHALVQHTVRDAGLPNEILTLAESIDTMEELEEMLRSIPERPAAVDALLSDIAMRFRKETERGIVEEHLNGLLPKFVYFDDYSTMRGRISVQDLAQRRSGFGRLDDADRTFLSLMSMAGADLEDLENETSYEYLKAELESASIGISDEIFAFWNQNLELRVEFDLSAANPQDAPPLNSGTILHVRIWNNRHRVSVPFDERSKGFVWFFSFLSYFSTLEDEEDAELILLLDEPGLNLHAMAQADFLKFIDDRLAPKHSVIYTTHSPFMINLDQLSRVRTVQDMDDRGTVISEDTLHNDRETVFPLQVALGSQMARTLFLAPHCLMVNAPSDLIYLQVLGEMAASRGLTRLDPRWVVIPVGGADNLPTFVSLLGESYVSVAVLMDVTPTNKEKVEQYSRNDEGPSRNPIKWVEVTRIRDADIEDLFEPNFYLSLVNQTYVKELPAPLTLKTISGSNPRIVQRISDYFRNENICGGRFDSYQPAAHLLQRHSEIRERIDDTTVDELASLFQRINSLLPTNGSSSNGSLRSVAKAPSLIAAG